MFGEAFTINPDDIENAGTRGRIQRIAADTLRAAGVHFGEDDRPPFDILAAMPNIEGAEDAKVHMIAAIVGIESPLAD
jgi:hypothetical protein